MFTTIFVIAFFAVVFGVTILLQAIAIRRCLTWRGVEGVTWRKTVASIAVMIFVQIIFSALLPASSSVSGHIAILIGSLFIQWQLLKLMFQTTLWNAFLAWMSTFVPAFAIWVIALLVIKPFVLQAYVLPTNSMAPTLLGPHIAGVCGECGSRCIQSVPDVRNWEPERLTICERFHETESPVDVNVVYASDRIIALKYLNPRRWDLVVFALPEDPSITYVKRLVGLPGESIEIRDGSVWVDGEKLPTPEFLSDIKYHTEFDNGWGSVWGSKESPAALGPDEYFVLGDFQSRAKDSRLWDKGAAGRKPYALPASHLQGVVTHIFWPPDRMRVLR